MGALRIAPLLWGLQLQLLASEAFVSPRTTDARVGRASATATSSPLQAQKVTEVDVCIIGGGIAGLSSAITTAEEGPDGGNGQPPSILLLESDSAVGGRVRSDYTDDGYILDRGFAVFIEEYPESKKLLDYDALKLKQFLPGARVKLPGRDRLASVSDPLRRRRDVFRAIASPVGSPLDKVRLLPLFYTVMTKTVDELFAMEETDALTCLADKYKFSEAFISSFFAPFFEGIFFTPLENQSSRMFHFVMRMFTVGSTALPSLGMQAVADQLASRAAELGVDIQLNARALSIGPENESEPNAGFSIEVESNDLGKHSIKTRCVVFATDGDVARSLLQDSNGVDKPLAKLLQRSVGNVYYAFKSPAPLTDPILVLNGEGSQQRNTKAFPINNVCFPSVVQKSYAPDGYELCSVSVLERALAEHEGDHDSIDESIRKQLSTWFPECAADILDESKWVQKGMYVINNAQPAHYGSEGCANIHGGRDSSTFQNVALPPGMFVCGDHMATSTFNGALESGVNAGKAVAKFTAESKAQAIEPSAL